MLWKSPSEDEITKKSCSNMNCYDFILFQDGRQVFGSREKKEELIARLGPVFEAQHNL